MIELKVNFDARAFRDTLSRAIMQSVVGQVKQKVGSVRCPTHGQAPTVNVQGRSIDQLSFEVEGCCQQLIDGVKAKLQ